MRYTHDNEEQVRVGKYGRHEMHAQLLYWRETTDTTRVCPPTAPTEPAAQRRLACRPWRGPAGATKRQDVRQATQSSTAICPWSAPVAETLRLTQLTAPTQCAHHPEAAEQRAGAGVLDSIGGAEQATVSGLSGERDIYHDKRMAGLAVSKAAQYSIDIETKENVSLRERGNLETTCEE